MEKTNWKGYFAMPNERNRERLTYLLKEEVASRDEKQVSNFIKALATVIKLIGDIPENLLINAIINTDSYNELIGWTLDGTDKHMSNFSINYYFSVLGKTNNVGINFKYSEPTEHKMISRAVILRSLPLLHSTMEYNEFKDSLINFLKKVYE